MVEPATPTERPRFRDLITLSFDFDAKRPIKDMPCVPFLCTATLPPTNSAFLFPTESAEVKVALFPRLFLSDAPLISCGDLSKDELGEDPWMALIHLFGKQEPMEIILEIAEEMNRSGHPVPDDEWLIAMAKQSPLWHQIAMLFISVRNTQHDRLRGLISSAPAGGELFERIRNKLLGQDN